MQIAVGDLLFEVDVSGPDSGPAVLLLHGFPQSRQAWSEVSPRLNDAGLRTVAPDQRGYSPGARPTGADAYGLPLLVADALGLLDALGIESAHVVGHDWGAVVAWSLAAEHPERVRTLTAVSIPHPEAFREALREDPDQKALSGYMDFLRAADTAEVLLADGAAELRGFYVEGGAQIPAQRVEQYVALHTQPRALDSALNWYRAGGLLDGPTVPSVSVPTTYVWSDGDDAVSRYGAERTVDHVTGSYRFVTLKGVSHWQPEQAPEEISDAILKQVSQNR